MPKKPTTTPTMTPRRQAAPKKPISITIEPDLLTQVDLRGANRSEILRTDLARYYRLLADTRARLRELLTPAELSAVIDIQNGHWYHDRLDAGEIVANVEDGCRLESLDTKWDIEAAALVQKLKSLDLLEVHALADATQRFWHAVGEGDERREPGGALD